METKQTSGFFRLNWIDIGKSVIVATLTAGLTAIYTGLIATPPVVDWKTVGIAAATAGVGYIIKNLFTPTQTIIK